jgi:hypothetical protein
LYDKLRSEFKLPSKATEDCYRNALGIKHGSTTLRRFPSVHKPTVWLTPRLSYYLNLETLRVKIVGELQILGHPRKVKDYLS